jgi:hypothetical protein
LFLVLFYQGTAPARADALQQSWTEKAETFLTRNTTEKNILEGLPARVVELPVDSVRTQTVVNAAEDNQRKKPKKKNTSLTTAGAFTLPGPGGPVAE